MDPSTLTLEFFIILTLVLFNGFLSMSEMAMVTARKLRLQQAAAKGDSGAKTALKLLEEPSQFLAAIQIGITLIGVFAGAFGGANIARGLSELFREIPLLAPYASSISLATVVLIVTLLSLLFGELVPKRLALGRAEAIASWVAKPINLISTIGLPAVKFLSLATEAILKIMRYKQPEEPPVTDEEVKMLLEQGRQAGVFEREEESIIKRTLRLSDRTVEEIMTNRLKLICLDIDDPIEVNLAKIKESSHTYFPVYQDNIDRVIGIVSIKDIFVALTEIGLIDLKSLTVEALFIPQYMPALKLMEVFKSSGKHFAIVLDEYGGLSGVITVVDLLESIVGDLPEASDQLSEEATQRADGSWLIDGIMDLEDVVTALELPENDFFPDEFQTLGGFLMNELGHIPRVGDRIFWKGWWLEVVDMDGNRVDKVIAYQPSSK